MTSSALDFWALNPCIRGIGSMPCLSPTVVCTLMMKLYAYVAFGVRLGTKICHTHTCPCGALVDDLGLHCFVCRKGNGKQTRHSLFNEVIWRSFLRAKIQASKEPLGTFRDNKRPDGVTLTPWQRGKCVAWDVTVADTFANSYLPLTAARAGAAAERAALNKHRRLGRSLTVAGSDR
mgnify:CR=1 FL=1